MARRKVLLAAGAAFLPGGSPDMKGAPRETEESAGRPPIPPNPDLANLYPVIDWIAAENAPNLSFLSNRWQKLEEWKEAARPVFRELLRYSPPAAPLKAEVVSREKRAGFTIEAVRISATDAYQIPGWVLVPENAKKPCPGILALHDHGGCFVWGHEKLISDPHEPATLTEFRNYYYGRPYAELLARKGYVVLVIDAFYFGSRRLRVEEIDVATAPGQYREQLKQLAAIPKSTGPWFDAVNGLCGNYEHLMAKSIFATGATWPGILSWDDRRSLDYLCSRPDVDRERIGCLGLSLGGLRTDFVVASDPRVKVACVTGWMTEFRAQLRNDFRSHTWMLYIPGLYSSMDLPDAVGLMAPNPLLVQQCSLDHLYSLEGMRGAVDKLHRIYAKAGAAEHFHSRFYDVPHSFRPQMQEDAFAWIEKWIG
ncbi:MAG TPA: alpha/beta hydrolase family protein [Bryobacteraceae bacterium]|nr:alpha/beta hydrolase family protein [Bryobacteraceae bacterium]